MRNHGGIRTWNGHGWEIDTTQDPGYDNPTLRMQREGVEHVYEPGPTCGWSKTEPSGDFSEPMTFGLQKFDELGCGGGRSGGGCGGGCSTGCDGGCGDAQRAAFSETAFDPSADVGQFDGVGLHRRGAPPPSAGTLTNNAHEYDGRVADELLERFRSSPMCDCVAAGENADPVKNQCWKQSNVWANLVVWNATVQCWPHERGCRCQAICGGDAENDPYASYDVDPSTHECAALAPGYEFRPPGGNSIGDFLLGAVGAIDWSYTLVRGCIINTSNEDLIAFRCGSTNIEEVGIVKKGDSNCGDWIDWDHVLVPSKNKYYKVLSSTYGAPAVFTDAGCVAGCKCTVSQPCVDCGL